MKKVLYTVLMIVLSISLQAQKNLKLVEKSAKEKPDWIVNNSDYTRNFFMVQANKAATIEEAQNSVMTTLMSQIASSVAVVITGELVNNTNWETVELNGKTKDEFIQTIKNNTTTKIAKMPSLQGVSLIKAEAYWEHYVDKKTKEDYYDYYILYPFSSFELDELIAAYNAQERAYVEKIETYRNSLSEKNDVDVLLNDVKDMKNLLKEFDEVDSKYGSLQNVVSLYEKTISNIYIDIIENENSKLVIQLKYDEKVMNTTALPKLRSLCARDFTIKHSGDKIVLTFNTFDCYEQDDNYVEIRFNFGNKKIVKKVKINL